MAREAEQEESYWRGSTYVQEVLGGEPVKLPDAALPKYGSVSARARQVYAAEALYNKDHIAAGFLALFLGIFGLHKFYLGCNQAAFSMLAFSIIGGLLTFGMATLVVQLVATIEAIIYFTRTQTQFQQIYVVHQRDWF